MSKEVKKEHNKKTVLKIKGWIGSKYVESVLVDCRPGFLVWNTKLRIFSVQYRIELPDKILRPLDVNEYGYFPYCFTSEEIESLNSIVISKEEIIEEVLNEVRQYIAVSMRDHILITGEILLTYCLEHIDTLHFPYFVGETESGKSTCLYLGKWLAYRCMMSHNLSLANIYNFLGTDEEGTGTICEDEAQDMASDREKIRIYKGSYSKGSIIPKVNMTKWKKGQSYYRSFGPKWFAGESVPSDKGFRERLVVLYMIGGKPQSNLKRSTDEQKEKLYRLRKKMLIWKFQNISREFPKYKSGLTGRDQELFEDFLSVFTDTKYKSQAKETTDYYLEQRHKTIKESLEPIILKIIKSRLESKMEIESFEIWRMITNSDELPGTLDATGKTFYPDYLECKVTLNSLSKILQYKFHAEKRVRYEMVNGRKKKVTYYVFDEEKVRILSEKYRID